MKSQADWIRLTDPMVRWQDRYPEIAAEVRAYLATIPPVLTISTRTLVHALFPDPRGKEGADAIKRLFKAVGAMAPTALTPEQ